MQYFLALILISILHCLNADVPLIKLNSGHEIPQIGLGTWQAKGAAAKQAVKDAIEIGYRHIDTSSDYKNQKEVGQAIQEQIQAGLIKREDLFVTTKVWPLNSNRQKSLQEVHNSLRELNLTYVDLVLVHFPEGDWLNVYRGIEDAYNQKLARTIGISNMGRGQIDQVLNIAKVKPANNQIYLNPKSAQDDTVNYCKQKGITVTGFSPLGTGNLVHNPTLAAIGKKHNKSAAQVAIRWQIQRGLIVVPKSTHKQYIKENFEVFDFTLTDAEMNSVRHVF